MSRFVAAWLLSAAVFVGAAVTPAFGAHRATGTDSGRSTQGAEPVQFDFAAFPGLSTSGAPPTNPSWYPDITKPRVNQTITFTGVASDPDDDIATYAWNWGDGTSTAGSASDQATHSYTTAGTYTVLLTVTDATALSVLFETSIAVRNNWAPESVSGYPDTAADAYPRVGTPALFDFYGDDPEDPTGAGLTWDVDWGDGTAHGTGSSPYVTQILHTWSTPGTYVIHYSATDSDGTGGGNPNKTTFGAPILVTVAANPAPQGVSWSTNVVRAAINQTVTFTGFAQDPDGGALAKYEWDFNGDGVYEGLSTDSPASPARARSRTRSPSRARTRSGYA